jgi:hypothetical protein
MQKLIFWAIGAMVVSLLIIIYRLDFFITPMEPIYNWTPLDDPVKEQIISNIYRFCTENDIDAKTISDFELLQRMMQDDSILGIYLNQQVQLKYPNSYMWIIDIARFYLEVKEIN